MMEHSEAFERLVAEIKPQVTEILLMKLSKTGGAATCSISLTFEKITNGIKGRAKGAMHLSRGI